MTKETLFKVLTENFDAKNPNTYYISHQAFENEDIIIRMVGFDQNNPHHCFDLWDHSMNCVKWLLVESPLYNNRNLIIASFLHDIGKPNVVQVKNDRNVFYGHAAVSAVLVKNLLIKWEFNKSDIDEICFYIAHHDDFINYKNKSEIENSKPSAKKYFTEINCDNIYEYFMDVCHGNIVYFERLANLCIADANSQADIAIVGKNKITKLEKVKKIHDIINTLHYITKNPVNFKNEMCEMEYMIKHYGGVYPSHPHTF